MWINELKGLYNEAWGPTTPNLPGNARGIHQPVETQDSLRYKGVFGAGGDPPNLALASGAGLGSQMPIEYEEEQSTLLDFDKWWKEEGGLYNFPSPEVEKASKKVAYEAWMAAKDFYDFGG